MQPDLLGFWGVVIGAVIAATVSIGGELLRGWHASRLDSQKRVDDRRIEVDRIQRTTLLDIQTALSNWSRAVQDVQFAQMAAVDHPTTPPEGLVVAEQEATRRLMFLTERVTDDALRTALTGLRRLWAEAVVTNMMNAENVTQESLKAEYAAMIHAADAVHQQLGTALRRYL